MVDIEVPKTSLGCGLCQPCGLQLSAIEGRDWERDFYKGDFDKRHFRQISVETICNVQSKFVLTADFSPGST